MADNTARVAAARTPGHVCPQMFTTTAGPASMTFDPRGGRLTSLRIDGFELLLPPTADPLVGGAYPMAPWAGRIRNGRFAFEGRSYSLAPNLGPHALHGTAFTQPWTPADEEFACDLAPWPFAGRARQRLELSRDGLTWELSVEARQLMPVTLGWHPWFVSGARLDLSLGRRYRRDAEGLPDGARVPTGLGPWDDCFEATGPHTLVWPQLTLGVRSDCDHVVVYNLRDDAVCVEPQSGPPDAVNLGCAAVVPAGGRLTRRLALHWG